MKNFVLIMVALVVSATGFLPDEAEAAFGRRKVVYEVHDAAILPSAGQELTLDQVQAAITRAARDRSWQVGIISDGHIEASILVRARHFVKVDINFTTTSYSITRNDSRAMLYKLSDGKIHRNYNKWVKLLEASILIHLNRQ